MVNRRRRVVWTQTAERALSEAAEYVAQDSQTAAEALVERLLKAASSLEHFASRGHPPPEFSDLSIPELLVQPYRLIYRVTEADVVVLALIHQRRDVERWRE
jgi:toxin ParE1/3/4